jgi:hypothetical protein
MMNQDRRGFLGLIAKSSLIGAIGSGVVKILPATAADMRMLGSPDSLVLPPPDRGDWFIEAVTYDLELYNHSQLYIRFGGTVEGLAELQKFAFANMGKVHQIHERP